MFDDSIVFENAKVYDNAIIKGYSIVQNNSIVFGNVVINNSHLWDNIVVRDATLINTDIDSDTVISCYTTIESCDFKDAVITSKNDFISMHLEGGTYHFL